jgi:hypothetical protein
LSGRLKEDLNRRRPLSRIRIVASIEVRIEATIWQKRGTSKKVAPPRTGEPSSLPETARISRPGARSDSTHTPVLRKGWQCEESRYEHDDGQYLHSIDFFYPLHIRSPILSHRERGLDERVKGLEMFESCFL